MGSGGSCDSGIKGSPPPGTACRDAPTNATSPGLRVKPAMTNLPRPYHNAHPLAHHKHAFFACQALYFFHDETKCFASSAVALALE